MYMIQGKLFKFEKCIFLLIVIASLASSNPPDNPCPQLFQYKFVGNEWIGVIQLDNIRVGQTINIIVRLALPALLSTSYVGRLDLLEGRQQAVQSVFHGRPLLYKITFPSQNPLPKLTEIIIDNAVICSGPPDLSPQRSSIQLFHTFYTKAIGNANRVDINEPSFDSFNDNNFKYPTVTSSPPLEEHPDFISSSDFSTSLSRPIFPNRKPQPSNINQSVFKYPIQMLETTKQPDFSVQGPQTPEQPEYPIPQQHLQQYPQYPSQQYPQQPNTPPTSSITPLSAQSNVVCGVPQVSQVTQFVVNGQSTKKGEWPWLAAIFVNNGPVRTFQCGGTLLTSKVTVTASHCFFREGQTVAMSPSEVFTALGRYNINNWADAGSEFLPTERIEFPPNYVKADSFEMDIAVIIHRRPVSFEEYPLIRPICLWSGSSNPLEIEGRMGTVVGWGEDEHGNKPTPEPKKVHVGIVSRKTCIRGSTQLEAVTTSSNFCAGERDGRGPCSGDSGSGLVIFNNNHWELRGVVAGTVQGGVTKTNQLCKLDEYVVYVDIFSFKDWIQKMMAI